MPWRRRHLRRPLRLPGRRLRWRRDVRATPGLDCGLAHGISSGRPPGIGLCGQRGPGNGGRTGVRRRPGPQGPVGLALLRSDRERQPRSLRVPDVDGLPVVDVDHRHPVSVEVGPVQRAVIDRQPAALIEAHDQMCARYPRVRDPQIGMRIPADDHLVACGERTLGPVVSDCQDRRGGSTHYSSIGPTS
jgi:hypothetical protein